MPTLTTALALSLALGAPGSAAASVTDAAVEPRAAPREGSDASAPASSPAAAEASASLEVRVFDEGRLTPRPGMRVSLWCSTCEQAPAFTRTQSGGIARFESMPPGEYELVVYAPGGPLDRRLELEAGAKATETVALPRDPYRPKSDKGRLNYTGFSPEGSKLRAELPLAIGGVLAVASLGFGVGAAVEALHPGCRYEVCDGGPRPRVVRALTISAGVTGGVALASLIYGGVALRRWRFGASVGRRGAFLSLRGRF